MSNFFVVKDGAQRRLVKAIDKLKGQLDNLKEVGLNDVVSQEPHINGYDSNSRVGRDMSKNKKNSLSITPSKHLRAAEKILASQENSSLYEKQKENRNKLLKANRY